LRFLRAAHIVSMFVARFLVVGSQYVVFEGTDGGQLLRTPLLRDNLACRYAILAIRLSGLLPRAYVRKQLPDGGFGFALHAADGTMLGTSPIFRTSAACEQAIDGLRREASNAYVVHVDADPEPSGGEGEPSAGAHGGPPGASNGVDG
jgi:uncharacterized protein YegP (UPF0339 family)